MSMKLTLAAVAVAAAAFCFAPQGASAAPQVGDAKQATKSNVEQAQYRRGHRNWRQRQYYRRGHYNGRRNYYRRPGFGIYLGF